MGEAVWATKTGSGKPRAQNASVKIMRIPPPMSALPIEVDEVFLIRRIEESVHEEGIPPRLLHGELGQRDTGRLGHSRGVRDERGDMFQGQRTEVHFICEGTVLTEILPPERQ